MRAIAAPGCLRVLVVDDEVGVAERFAGVLRDKFGADVVIRPDGYQALDVLLSEHVDVAIIDQFMPGVTGLQVVERLRDKGSIVPVIVVTDLVTPGLVGQVEALSSTAVLPKSVDAPGLAAAVMELAPSRELHARLVVDNSPMFRELSDRRWTRHPFEGTPVTRSA